MKRTATSHRINAPTGGGTEILGIVEDDTVPGVGGTLDASGLAGLREIRLLNKGYDTDDAEKDFGATEPDSSALSGDLTGYENGFTVINAPADTRLVTRLNTGTNNGTLTIDGQSPFTLNTLLAGSSTIAALNLTDVSTFTLDIDETVSPGTPILTIASLNADPDLQKIVATKDANDSVGVTIGNDDETLAEERSAGLTEYDGSGINGPQIVSDLQSSDSGYLVTTGIGNDQLALGDDNIDDNVSSIGLIGDDVPNSGDFNDDPFAGQL